jgi:hypothetical protein
MDMRVLGLVIPLVGTLGVAAIIAIAYVKAARLRANPPEVPSPDVAARLDALERSVQGVLQELAETQERLDFAERLLGKAREERRVGG